MTLVDPTKIVVPVLDKGFVRLVRHSGNDTSIVQAARVSLDSGVKTPEDDVALIYYLMHNRHTSPFEHVKFEFHVACPIFVARQWRTHRTGSTNEVSARYTELEDQFWQPSSEDLRGQGKGSRQVGSGGVARAEEAVEVFRLAYREAYRCYESLLALGVCREQARAVLPVGVYTQFYWAIDLHNLLHFLGLRDHPHAQEEIRAYARALLGLAELVAPVAVGAWNGLGRPGSPPLDDRWRLKVPTGEIERSRNAYREQQRRYSLEDLQRPASAIDPTKEVGE